MKQLTFAIVAAMMLGLSSMAYAGGCGSCEGKEGHTHEKVVKSEECTKSKDCDSKAACDSKEACDKSVVSKEACETKCDSKKSVVSAEAPAAPGLVSAPQFSLQDHNGKTHNLADYKGKIVVLEWFNEKCPFVKDHYQAGKKNTMVDLAKKYAEKDVVWFAVNSSHFADNAHNKKTAEKWNMPFPILNDSTGEVGKAYGAKRTPQMIVINADQQIIYNGMIDDNPLGKKDSTDHVFKNQMAKILEGKTDTFVSNKAYGCSVKYKGAKKANTKK